MPMTVKDAHDINTVLRWLRGDNTYPRSAASVSAEDTLNAARRLATRAYSTLGAGLAPGQVSVKMGEYRPGMTDTDGDPAEVDRRHVDVSDADGVLAGFDIRDKDGYPELVCSKCRLSSKERRLGEVCEVDDGDSMDTLVRMCLDHEHEEP